ncbi:putative phage abortive infection protein [Pectobacterium aroidearum]|uniref:putative phage abortive infection protein n=1 Tax=Pectobacterium aroidearum TaxID=1201031 RepID=UPI00261B282A|nr:putative phage abortive infection protein [Pectobacterium aroidearum]WKA64180.1 putative phage abortive infection protein [Pectobacterium aroidearum]
MLFILVVILILSGVFWSWFQTNLSLISGLATALAFLATAWAAYEGRKSARAAFRAVKTSEDALEETRKNYLRDAFNQRFSLLLEQHNTYLEKVNNYVRTEPGWNFITKTFNSNQHFEAFDAMSGHVVLSPYMRILYHTLKFIDQDYFGSKDDIVGRRKYTSLIRSLISNDVLFLIAVNSSYISSEGRKNQYHKYQYLLQRFGFFEHANFFNINHQSEFEKNNELKEPFHGIEGNVRLSFHNYITEGKYNSISDFEMVFRTPVIVAYIYKNPHQNTVMKWFDSFPKFLIRIFDEKKEKRNYEKIFNIHFSNSYLDCYIDKEIPVRNTPYNVDGKNKLDVAILKSIIRAIRNERLKPSFINTFIFIKQNENVKDPLSLNYYLNIYNTIKDYNYSIDRKNETLFRTRYLPVRQMANKVRVFEKELRKQCALE